MVCRERKNGSTEIVRVISLILSLNYADRALGLLAEYRIELKSPAIPFPRAMPISVNARV